MDNKSTTKRMIGAVVLVLIAALLLAWLLKGKNPKSQPAQTVAAQQDIQPINGFPGVAEPNAAGDAALLPPPSSPPALVANAEGVVDPTAAQNAAATTEQAVDATATNAEVLASNTTDAAQAVAPANSTTFEIRPGEVRSSVDKDGKVVETTGSMGGDDLAATQDDKPVAGADGSAADTTKATADTAPAAVASLEASSASAAPKSLIQGAESAPSAAKSTAATQADTATNNAAAKEGNGNKEVLVSKPSAAKSTAATQADAATNNATAKEGNGNKEVLVSKPSAAKSAAATVAAASKPAPATSQPRLVNERRVPEIVAVEKPTRTAPDSKASMPAPAKTTAPAKTNTVTVAKAAPVAKSAPAPKQAAEPKNSGTSSKSASSTAGKVPSVDALTASAAQRNGYVIQVLATGDKGKADTIRHTISTDGYPVFVAQSLVNGKQVYRVRVGTYKAKSDAVSVQSRMKVRYGQNQFVQNSFVTNNN